MSTERSQLTSRIPPLIQLSSGSPSSKTAPPQVSLDTKPAEQPRQRFSVTGNAIVTGGAGGIGSVSCRALLEHGLKGLAIFDLHPDEAQRTIAKLQPDFPDATITFYNVDITNPDSVTEAVRNVHDSLGSIDVMVCFAGIAGSVHALDISLQEWTKMLQVNTTGAFLCA